MIWCGNSYRRSSSGGEAVPSFYEGLLAQIVADAVLESYAERTMGRNSGRTTLG